MTIRVSIIRNDILPLIGVRARDDRDDGLSLAHVENLVRDPRLDVDEVARLVLDDLLEAGAVFMPHATLEDVEHQLEANVNVSQGDAAWRNGCDVHRKLRRADVVRAHPHLVLNSIPVPAVAAPPD